jgi:opacity protein-like surface antigen
VAVNSNPVSSFPTQGFAGSNQEYPDGFIGGGQIGYNWQVTPIWVVGLEADFQGALEKDQNTLTNNFDGRAHPTLFVVTGSPVDKLSRTPISRTASFAAG